MTTRERFIPYVTSRTFADPTAWEAMRNVERSPKSQPVDRQDQPNLAALITTLSEELRGLKQRRRLKEITRGEYTELRAPLVANYHTLLQAYLIRRGGETT